MQKLTIILVSFILIFLACKSEEKLKSLNEDFIFTIEFYPAFIASSRVVIEKKGEKEVISIDNIFFNNFLKDLTAETGNTLLLDKDFLAFFGDTLFVKRLENQEIKKKYFLQFAENIGTIDLSKQKSLIKEDFKDGITIYFRYQTENSDNQFSFRCPDKSDTTEFKIITSLISLFENSFNDSNTNNYVEKLKGFFDYM